MSEAEAVATVQVVGGRVTEEEAAALVAVLELIAARGPAADGPGPGVGRPAVPAGWRRVQIASPQSWARSGGGWG